MSKTIIIDTADRAFDMCLDYVCDKEEIRHPSELDFGKGWSLVKKEWTRVIQKLNMLDSSILILSHETLKKHKLKKVELDRFQPDLNKSGLNIIEDLSDIILHYNYADNDAPMLFSRGVGDRMAGCRGGQLSAQIKPTFEDIEKDMLACIGGVYGELNPTITIYGPPKIGKSTLGSTFPNAVFADFENGLKWLNVEKTLIKTWEDFLAFCAKIADDINNEKGEE